MQLKEMMDEICSRWSLPKDYIEFLFNHENNLYVNVDDDDDEDLILSILVDTFISKISFPMQPGPEIGSISDA